MGVRGERPRVLPEVPRRPLSPELLHENPRAADGVAGRLPPGTHRAEEEARLALREADSPDPRGHAQERGDAQEGRAAPPPEPRLVLPADEPRESEARSHDCGRGPGEAGEIGGEEGQPELAPAHEPEREECDEKE